MGSRPIVSTILFSDRGEESCRYGNCRPMSAGRSTLAIQMSCCGMPRSSSVILFARCLCLAAGFSEGLDKCRHDRWPSCVLHGQCARRGNPASHRGADSSTTALARRALSLEGSITFLAIKKAAIVLVRRWRPWLIWERKSSR